MNDKPPKSKDPHVPDMKDRAVSEQDPAAANAVERGRIHTGEPVEIIGINERPVNPPQKK
jgi:translation elongation factor EF-Tu-like GTPase